MTRSRRDRPNFFVVGTFKGGTTSIFHYLAQHPDIYMPRLKEPRYFAYDCANPDHRTADVSRYPIRSEEQYLALFDEVRDEIAIGEASPIYLDSPDAAARIAKFSPNARIIVSLRDPVARAFSGYQMWVRSGGESRPVTEALRPGERWVEGSLYADKLRRYYDCFPRDRIKVVLFEDLIAQPTRIIRDMYDFLGVSSEFVPDTSFTFNPGGLPRNRLVQSVLHRLKTFARKDSKLSRFTPDWTRRAYYRLRRGNLVRVNLPVSVDRRLAEYFLADAQDVARISGAGTERWQLQARARI